VASALTQSVSVGIHVPSSAVAALDSGVAYAEFFQQVEALGLDAVFGPARDVAARLAEHVDAGITKLMLGVPSLDLTHLRRVAHEVAPVLRARSAASR
jgi:hypothetical protein